MGVLQRASSRRVPTARAQVESHIRSCAIYGRQNGTGTVFLRELRFPLTMLIPPTASHSSSVILGRYARALFADIQSRLRLTP
jgi:hypothetical protein